MLEIYFHRKFDEIIKQIDEELYLLRIFHSSDGELIEKQKATTFTSDQAKDWKLKEHLYSELDVIDRRLTQFLPLLAGLFASNGVMIGFDMQQLTNTHRIVNLGLVQTAIIITGISLLISISAAIISTLSPTSWVSRRKYGITDFYMEKRFGDYCCEEKTLERLQMLVLLILTRIGRDKRLMLTKVVVSWACFMFILAIIFTLTIFIQAFW